MEIEGREMFMLELQILDEWLILKTQIKLISTKALQHHKITFFGVIKPKNLKIS